MNFEVFKHKRILVTGHTGFKGSWLTLWLYQLGAQVYGYSLPPPTTPSNYELSKVSSLLAGEWVADIRDREQMKKALLACQPEIIFHLAAQPLVCASYREPFETFEVNVMGTASLLDAVRSSGKPCAVICITTDKCYENREREEGYSEEDPMGGYDPYSASKGAAEILIASYRRAFFNLETLRKHGVQLASARAGNVVGGGDFAEDRIVVDLVKSMKSGTPTEIRNPVAIRPWQHVLEPLSGYLTLAEKMVTSSSGHWCEGWNFGPMAQGERTVRELADLFFKEWGSGGWKDVSHGAHPHEAGLLRLKIGKASQRLGWVPRWSFETMIQRTVNWYRQMDTMSPRQLCLSDIIDYSNNLTVPNAKKNER
jgi:CDP-glucose 4,6-dehydratase